MVSRQAILLRTVEEDIDSVLVQKGLHGLPHLVKLLEGRVGGVPRVVRARCYPAGEACKHCRPIDGFSWTMIHELASR
jgi:hypothetical protein